eukprot:163193-Chlamydomonas_euryale.AAC.2
MSCMRAACAIPAHAYARVFKDVREAGSRRVCTVLLNTHPARPIASSGRFRQSPCGRTLSKCQAVSAQGPGSECIGAK